MRILPTILVLTGSLLAQQLDAMPERVRRSLVEVRVTDHALLEAVARLRRRAKTDITDLSALRIHQPYTLVVTGVIVSPKGLIVMPALHPRAELNVQVTMFDGTVQTARIRGNDAATNIALVQVPGPVPAHLAFAAMPLDKRGTEFMIAGYRRGARDRPQELKLPGIVHPKLRRVLIRDLYSRRQVRAWAGVLRSLPGAPFQCGAACIDGSGRLAGLRIGGISYLPLKTTTVSLHYFIPGQRLERIVKDLAQHSKVKRAYFGVRWKPLPNSLRAHFKLSGGAKYAVQIDRTGPAWKAGLRLNDVLLGVNGKSYSHQADLEQALFDCKTAQASKLKILHHGKPQTLKIQPK